MLFRSLELFDVKKGKTMKTISRAGNDPDQIDAAKKDLQEMKENIPVVRENRIRILLKEYLHPVRRRTADWMKTYMDNPVLRILAELFVWTAEKEDGTSLQFMLREDGKIINRNGAEITLQDSFRIFLSNPCNMDEEELMQWRRHLMDDSVVQPFHQMFENVYSFSDTERLRNRYLDMEIEVRTGMKEYLQKNSARIEENGDGGYIISIGHNAINVGGYSPHESLKKLEECWGSLELYKVSADCFTYRNPEKNHFIHILDELCFKEAIYGGDTETMERLKDFLNERIALELIEFIKGKEINKKQQKSLNWLTDYYNALHAR